MPPVAEIFYNQSLANSDNKDSLRTKREMHTLAVILDHLAVGRYREAADTAGPRMKALELAARTGNRKLAAQVELVPQDTALTLLGNQEVEMAGKNAKKKDELDNSISFGGASRKQNERMEEKPRLTYPPRGDNAEWIPYNQKGKGKGKDKDKGKGKSKFEKKAKDKKKKKNKRKRSSPSN